jgi:hypothetical protein
VLSPLGAQYRKLADSLTPDSLFSFRSSTILDDVLAHEDVLSSGANLEENHHGHEEEESEERVILHLADKFGRTLPRWALTPFGAI